MEPIGWITAVLAGIGLYLVYALARAIARRIGRGMDTLGNAPYEDGDGY